MKDKLVIIGVGANAKQAYDFIKIHDLFDVIGFAVDQKYITANEFKGLPIFALETLEKNIDISKVKIFVALGWNKLNADRKKLYERLKTEGYRFANLIAPTAIIRGKVEGDNCWINDYAVLQSDSVIKSNVIIREHAIIGNNTIIEEHCFIALKSLLAGGCTIGKQSFCGINSTVFDGTSVGKKCIIGGCAVVKRNVPDNTVCKTDLNATVVKTYDADTIESKLLFKFNVR